MVIAIWTAAFMLFFDLLFVYIGAAKRERTTMTWKLAAIYTLTRGFYITVLVLAATKGVAP